MGRTRRTTILAATAALLLSGAVQAPAATATVCPTGWGSLPKSSTVVSTATLHNIRTGAHPCFDRVVFDLNGNPDGYAVRYVNRFYTEGEGRQVATRGGAKLLITLQSPAYDETGEATYLPTNRMELISTSGKRTLRQGAWLGSFEGQTSVGLGVRARLPYRVQVLDGPGSGSRMVIDIAHTW